VFPIFKENVKLKDRLQAWISYVLLLNFAKANPHHPALAKVQDISALKAVIASVKHSNNKAQLNLDELPMLTIENAQLSFERMLHWFTRGNQQVLFVNPDLVSDLKNFSTPEEAAADRSFNRKWEGQAEQKGKFAAYDALSNNPYFAYFYARVPEISAEHLQIYFDIYLPMQEEQTSIDEKDSDSTKAEPI